MKNYFNRYLQYVRKQSKHVQHIHAGIFAVICTTPVVIFVLYTDYGFWHERYVAEEYFPSHKAEIVIKSPSEIASRFWSQAKIQFGNIGSVGASLLEGKETYINQHE